MSRKNILFIGGSLNQTTITHAVARHLEADYDCYFSPFYADGMLGRLAGAGWLDFSILGGRFRSQSEAYLRDQGLKIDFGGRAHDYDLVVTTTDLIVQRNIRHKPIVLIQEGMTDPETWMYHLVRHLGLPRFLASTATTGLSDAYRVFCVASNGYRDLFIGKGVKPDKLVVTGIPNFDHASKHLAKMVPYRRYALVATSDTRETFKFDNRRRFIARSLEIAGERPVIFKLHPNERFERAAREIYAQAPRALVVQDADAAALVAHCDVLITQYSSVAFLGLALGKEVHSYFDLDLLRRLLPIQNGGMSARNIARVCRTLLAEGAVVDTMRFTAHANAF